MTDEYVSLLEYKELRLWGNIIEDRVEDIFITNTLTEEVIFKGYNVMVKYKDPRYFNLVRDGQKVLMAISFLDSLEGITDIQRDMEIDKVCTTSFKKGSLTLTNLYAAKERDEVDSETSRRHNERLKREYNTSKEELINEVKEQGNTALLDGYNILIIKGTEVPAGDPKEIIHFIKGHKHFFKDRILYEQEHLDDYTGAIKEILEEKKDEKMD